MIIIDAVIRQGRFVRMHESDVPVNLLDTVIDGPAALSHVDLSAFTGDTVHPGILNSKASLTGGMKWPIFLGGRATLLIL